MGAHSALLRQSTGPSMSIVYFTLVAALLYLFSDWVLQRAEVVAGRRFEHRSLIFFCILLALALMTFTLIGQLTGNNQGV